MIKITDSSAILIKDRNPIKKLETRGYMVLWQDTAFPGLCYLGPTNNLPARIVMINTNRPSPTCQPVYVSRQFSDIKQADSMIQNICIGAYGYKVLYKGWYPDDHAILSYVEQVEDLLAPLPKPITSALPVVIGSDPTKVIPALNIHLTVNRLKEVLKYDSITGEFTWVKRKNLGSHIGDQAGTITTNGSRWIGIDNKTYPAVRLAWIYMYGSGPVGKLVHINGNMDDNSIINIQDMGVSQ